MDLRQMVEEALRDGAETWAWLVDRIEWVPIPAGQQPETFNKGIVLYDGDDAEHCRFLASALANVYFHTIYHNLHRRGYLLDTGFMSPRVSLNWQSQLQVGRNVTGFVEERLDDGRPALRYVVDFLWPEARDGR